MAKTVQAMKISASWTPRSDAARQMTEAAFGSAAAAGMKIHGGRLALRHAIKSDFTNPAFADRFSKRVAQITEHLESAGELHSITITAGAVLVADAEVLDEPARAEPSPADPASSEGDPVSAGEAVGSEDYPAPVEETRGHSADDAAAAEIPGRKSRKAAPAAV
jgi:hypothetical protein